MATLSDRLLRYSPDVERIAPDEAETQTALVEQLLKISQTTFDDGKGALRSVHAKSHGLLKARLIVPRLDPTLAQGLFAEPGEYPVAMRLSTSPGDLLPDSVSTPRGLGIKVLGVKGERLPGSEGDTTQDFALVSGKSFIASNAAKFLKSLRLLAATTDRAEGLKVALSYALRATESAVEALGGKSATLAALGGYPETHILGECFFSQVPIRFGDFVAKFGVYPSSAELLMLQAGTLDPGRGQNLLREAVRAHFASKGGAWELRAQLCTDLQSMPVEDATVAWDEKKSPYRTVAVLEAPPQDSWDEASIRSIDKALAFSPWHCLAAHQPLGSINRARRVAYPASACFRLQKSGCPFVEPTQLD